MTNVLAATVLWINLGEPGSDVYLDPACLHHRWMRFLSPPYEFPVVAVM